MRRAAKATRIDARLLRRWPLPRLGEHADKVTRGDVLVVGGSMQIPGAVALAGEAALRAGAGRVQLGTVRGAALALAALFPEAKVIGLAQTPSGEIARRAAGQLEGDLAACDALVIGPGMRDHAVAEQLLRELSRSQHRPVAVLDAAALRLFRRRNRLPRGKLAGIIATPHAGEMADLWGCPAEQVHDDPLSLAVEAARALNVTLVLKGVRTFIVDPDGRAFENVAGNSGLATAGSGDVLSGLIAGLAARGAEPVQAAVWGVYLHAKAGDALKRQIGPLGYLARELAAKVPAQLAQLARRVP
jgi:ADP-dependent NAD(P)H-hydrate dehydratase